MNQKSSQVYNVLSLAQIIITDFFNVCSMEHPPHQRVRLNSSSLQLDLDIELGTNEVKGQHVLSPSISVVLMVMGSLSSFQEVSLAHLFKPADQHKTEYVSTLFGGTQSHQSDLQQSSVYRLGANYDEVLDQPLPSSCGPSFPWAGFREHHSTHDVLLHYHPLCMDNYEFFVGANISTLSLQSYMVSNL